ncbi:Alpha-ketoglutarate-dependent dioxygenase alkB homolog 6; AltName: Full=Alkylated DNA repair protein alkB homolog 6 [Serendipita indica DSM 11827]|uniref:Fe2OG dioxygenase domain-containing protein n=1 Tax=Serendipita indica (strain DSM 11827) TaxID=1109443 RepID=G4TXW3_SERID|nr:Alpha-ketoglutarate-dependent dioxygenase alkB homolog 6; AltName: Full=Alkylated DNA repair protein alkB homolog 6 [Serendipita indica DSM 11827]CCA76156.1 hypothetical protein PIIN_10156 [Serendipita indica DSM 11827]
MSIDPGERDVRLSYRYIPNFITQEEEEYLLRKISETPQPKWKNVTGRRLQIWGGDLGPGGTLLAQPLPPFINSFPNLVERIAATKTFQDSAHQGPNHVIINEYKPGEGIMPHEDGPAYHPVVATISLGSHAVFHYLRYKPDDASIDDDGEVRDNSTDMKTSKGKVIDKTPVLSLLLEPRSVIITSGTLYKDHLHWIEDVAVDHIAGADETAQPDAEENRTNAVDSSLDVGSPPPRYRMDNWEQVTGEREKEVVRSGGVLERGTRVSLTCRDVAKVRKIGLLKR